VPGTLPDEVVETGTLTAFEKHLDGYMNREGIAGYGPSKSRRFVFSLVGAS